MNNNFDIKIKNPPLRVGVLTPPNDHYKPVLYSHAEATKQFNKLSEDLYLKQEAAKPEERHKMPKSVFYILGVIGLACLVPFVKKILFRK